MKHTPRNTVLCSDGALLRLDTYREFRTFLQEEIKRWNQKYASKQTWRIPGFLEKSSYGNEFCEQHYQIPVVEYDPINDFFPEKCVFKQIDGIGFICESAQGQCNARLGPPRGPGYGVPLIYDVGVDYKRKIFYETGPKFLREPDPFVFDLTQKDTNYVATLTCYADGYPAPTYRWFRYEDGVGSEIKPLNDELKRITISGGSLIINNPNPSDDRGKYFCEATNRFGTIRSREVPISFGHIGDFNLQRSEEYGKENWGKALFCDPPPSVPELTYHWVRNKFPDFVEEDKRTFVSFDGHLYFSALEKIDEGKYSCNVKTNVSSTGKHGPFFDLKVVHDPNYQQLQFPNNFPKAFPETPIAGQDVRLECMSFGYPVPSYEWSRENGGRLPKKARLANYNRVLIIPNVTLEDEGRYVCKAANSRVSREDSANLRIQAEPRFIKPLQDQYMDVGERLMWVCEAFGKPSVKYRWLKDGVLLNETLTCDDTDLSAICIFHNVLKIRRVDETHKGMYECSARSQLGVAYSSAELRVLVNLPVSFERTPLDPVTMGVAGENLIIPCEPEGAPRPDIAWQSVSGDQQPPEFQMGLMAGATQCSDGSLLFVSLEHRHEGYYTCVATSRTTGQKVQSSTFLEVEEKPCVEDGASVRNMQTSVLDQEVRLPCLDGYRRNMRLDVGYQWKHYGRIIRTSDPWSRHATDDDGTLIIRNITMDDAGHYECDMQYSQSVATGSNRKYCPEIQLPPSKGRCVAMTIDLVVNGPLGPPGGVRAHSLDANSAWLTWVDANMVNDDGLNVPLEYVVEGKTNWNDEWRELPVHPYDEVRQNETLALDCKEPQSSRGSRAYCVTNLAPWSSYEFRVRAANLFGPGLPSDSSPTYKTEEDVPYTAPTNISGGGGKTGDLTVTWTPLPGEEQNAPDIYYKIYWRRLEIDQEYEYQSKELTDLGNIGMHVILIPKQYYYSKYGVVLQAINRAGPGVKSEEAVVFSAEDIPQVPPTEVGARAHNSTSIRVTWQPVDDTRENMRGQLTGYRVSI
ncbi:unnamed protein product, partial [Notodromas monacha]